MKQADRKVLREELAGNLLNELTARMEDHMFKRRGNENYTEDDKKAALVHIIQCLT